MTPEAQRIAIAEACGWTFHCMYEGRPLGFQSWQESPGDKKTAYVLPDYPADLNAMHEAEMTLDMDKSYDYGDRLARMVREPENIRFKEKPAKRFPLNGWGHFHVAHLTAAKRAEAFLRTIGKWQEIPSPPNPLAQVAELR